eukprot:c38946_g1_i1 orf=232-825(-)
MGGSARPGSPKEASTLLQQRQLETNSCRKIRKHNHYEPMIQFLHCTGMGSPLKDYFRFCYFSLKQLKMNLMKMGDSTKQHGHPETADWKCRPSCTKTISSSNSQEVDEMPAMEDISDAFSMPAILESIHAISPSHTYDSSRNISGLHHKKIGIRMYISAGIVGGQELKSGHSGDISLGCWGKHYWQLFMLFMFIQVD